MGFSTFNQQETGHPAPILIAAVCKTKELHQKEKARISTTR
jgi:hypothetical protein